MANKQTTQKSFDLPTMVVEESKTLDPGTYTGELMDVKHERRGNEKFPYVDVFVRAENGMELKAGYPASAVTANGALGRLLERFGAKVEVGQPADWSVLRKGMTVRFETDIEENANGRFTRLKPGTLAPAK